jgi:hypothetical protein
MFLNIWFVRTWVPKRLKTFKIEMDVHNHVENLLEIEGSFSKVQIYMIKKFIFVSSSLWNIYYIMSKLYYNI